MITTCPSCHSKLSIDESMIGRRVQCAGCRHFFNVPAPPGHVSTQPVPASPAHPAPPKPPPKPERPAPAPAPVPVTREAVPAPAEGEAAGLGRSLARLRGPLALGKLAVLVGLVVVLLARGGGVISSLGVARAQAKTSLARSDFDAEWQARIQAARKDKDTKKVASLQAARDKTRAELTDGEWADLDRAARNASTNQKILVYWLEWLFWLGSIVLVIGLLLVAFYGTGAERVVCLIMIAVITFSIYVGRLGISMTPGR